MFSRKQSKFFLPFLLFVLFVGTALSVSAHHKDSHPNPPWYNPGPGNGAPVVSGDAGPPTDYTQVENLSENTYPETIRETYRVPMHDGVEVYVEIVRPDPEAYPDADNEWPVIMEVSPYHGTLADRDGIRIFPDPVDENGDHMGLTGYFAPKGYAVAMVDLRGTGRSQGCLDHLGEIDAKDLKRIVEWAADAEWSTGKVGLTGHSYVGSTPSVAAAQKPRGLETIVPSAGLASMYDHQFQYGVPFNLQWVGPIAAYSLLSTERHLMGEDYYGEEPETIGCGWEKSAITAGHGQLTGEYQAWHAERDWRDGAAKADIPIFMVHGVNDNAARISAAEWFFGNRPAQEGDKVWLGQWDHGSPGGMCDSAHPTCRGEQWQYAVHAWFDNHLKDLDVDTGPPVEVFLNDDLVWTANSWNEAEAMEEFYPNALNMGLSSNTPFLNSSKTFTALPVDLGETGGYIEFETDQLTEDMLFAGIPKLNIHTSLATSQLLNLVTTLYREDEGGERHAMNYCTVNPHLRHSVSTPAAVVPLEEMDLSPQCFTMAHNVKAGEKLVLRVGTTSPHHVSTFTMEALATIFTGKEKSVLQLPVIKDPVIYEDTALTEQNQ